MGVELPKQLVNGRTCIALIAGSADPNFTAFHVYLSYDGESYQHLAVSAVRSVMGRLMSDLPSSGVKFDPTAELYVDVTESPGELNSVSVVAMAAGDNMLMLARGEIVTFQNAELVGPSPYQYRLWGLMRGWYDTNNQQHYLGDMFSVLRRDVDVIDFPEDMKGQIVYLKYCGINRNGEEQPIDEVDPIPVTFTGRPTRGSHVPGTTYLKTAGEDGPQGSLVYVGADERVYLATASDHALLGLTIANMVAGQKVYVQQTGPLAFEGATPYWTWTPGAMLYASAVPGQLSQTENGLPIGIAENESTVDLFVPPAVDTNGNGVVLHNIFSNKHDTVGTPAQHQMMVCGATLWELITAPVDDARVLVSGTAAQVGIAMPTHALVGLKHLASGLTIGHILQALSATSFGFAIIPTHASRHQNAGADEISVAALSGLLADGQTPLAHKTSHQDGGADELSVAALSGLLADAQKVTIRKNSGADVGTRKRVNLIEGTGVSLALADDAVGDEVDVTIAAAAGGNAILYLDNTDHGTGAVSTEVILATYTMDANKLASSKGLRIKCLTLSNRTGYETNTYKLYFGATVIASWSDDSSTDDVNKPWVIEAMLFNTATNAQRIMREYNGNSGIAYTTAAIDTTAAVVIKTTGQTSNPSDELTNKMFIIEYLP